MKKKACLIGGLLILFVIITVLVMSNNISNFDDSIYNFIFGLRNNFLDIYFKGVTCCANTITVICLLIVLLLVIKDKYRNVLGITALSTVLTNQILKNIFTRPRPDHLRLVIQGGYSYPSGHAMISIAIYGFLIYYVYHKVKNKTLKIVLIGLLTLLIISIGLSRIYVGVHYPSDILGGYALALLILILVILGVDKYAKDGSK